MFHEELRAYCRRGNCAFRLSQMSLPKDLMLGDCCPELGRVMEELIRGGFGERLSDAFDNSWDDDSDCYDRDLFLPSAEEVRQELLKTGDLRPELVNYAIDSVSYAFEFLDEVKVPEGVREDPWEDLMEEYEPYADGDGSLDLSTLLYNAQHYDDWLDELMLGHVYSDGDGVRQSYPRAMKWYRISAENRCAAAMNAIAGMYSCGTGVREDEETAALWYRKALSEKYAEDGDRSWAESCLHDMLFEGRITWCDGQEKVKWLTLADSRGIMSAARQLGDMYASGDGIAEDLPEALRWYRKAADDGDPKAMIPLGLMYKNGTGTGLDYEEALRWLRKAAESPFELAARYHLGTMYREGKGVPRDPGEAMRLFLSAVAFGCPEADSRSGRCMRGARESPRTPARPCSITGMPRGGAPLRRCSALAKCTGTAGALSRTSGGPGSSLMTRLSSGTKEPRRPFRGCREKTAGPGRRSETAGNARDGSAAGSQNEL